MEELLKKKKKESEHFSDKDSLLMRCEVSMDQEVRVNNYPACACAIKGLCDRSWCLYIYYILLSALFFGTNLLSPKILTFRGLF